MCTGESEVTYIFTFVYILIFTIDFQENFGRGLSLQRTGSEKIFVTSL